MSTSKSTTTAMQYAKDKAEKRPSFIKDGKKGNYRREAVGCSYSRKIARDPLWVLLNS